MFSKSKLGLAVLAVLCVSDGALGRIRWMERDDRAILLHPRRFGQENPAVIQKLSAACPGQVCGSLSGEAITPLLAAQPECSQQDMADKIIDAAQQFDAATKANMIAIAIEYRQAEKNTPPDFTTNPPTPRNSVFCQKAPKNPELNGLVQAQDPANGDVFFDPATKASVQRGAQPNTAPFGGAAGGNGGANNGGNAGANNGGNTGANNGNAGGAAGNDGTAGGANNGNAGGANNGNAGGANNGNAGGAAGAIGDFGSCSVPEIEFGVGFDNRKETSFRPVDLNSFNHGSAQAIGIITTFVCDQLVNKCGADQTAKDTCAKAKAAANGGAAKTGIQADLFNAAFGKKTNFAGVQAIDDQGRAVGGAGGNTGAANLDTQTGNAGNTGNNAVAAGGIGDFGSCSIPEVEFGAGFEGRKETSFQPKDKNSFNHGSAQAFGIISQFICDTLTNKCGADQAAKDTCAKATAAANAAPAKTGKQADAFNAAFGIQTNFGAVQAIDNQGRPVAGTGAGNAGGNTGNAGAGNNGNANAGNNAGNTGTGNANTGNTGAANTGNAGAGGNLQTFTGALGGVVAPTVTASGNGDFQVQGNASFKALRSAVVRSCDVQNNQCANAANSSGNKGDLTVTNCNAQQQRCIAAAPQ